MDGLKRIEPGDDRYEEFVKWWLANGQPRQFQREGFQYLALRDNDRLLFIPERAIGIDNTSSFGRF